MIRRTEIDFFMVWKLMPKIINFEPLCLKKERPVQESEEI